MPDQFEDRWEYYTPDEEINEIVYNEKHSKIRNRHDAHPRLGEDRVIGKGKPLAKRTKCSFKESQQTFKEMWLAGYKAREIMEVIGCTQPTINVWRRKLKLPKRMPGHYTQQKQVEYMSLQHPSSYAYRPIREIFRAYGVVDSEGKHINGTDKETNHRYGDTYETLFYDRSLVKLMMEIGIADGSSLCAWREVFPNALCVGMDIHPSTRATGDRIEFNFGDQTKKEDCERAAAGRLFDFICEDATHKLEDSLRTLLYLWPFVKPGGLYVIEEFANIGNLEKNLRALFPNVQILNTNGPFGGVEPLVVFRKV